MISLGCAKNTVDSESMAQILGNAGYRSSDDPSKAHFLIVNTCGFIAPAREESYEVLQDLADHRGQQPVVAGQLDALGAGTRDELLDPLTHRRRVACHDRDATRRRHDRHPTRTRCTHGHDPLSPRHSVVDPQITPLTQSS